MTAPEIRQEIENTREQLGQTVEELAAKADVPARARGKAAEVSGRVRATVGGLPAWARQSQVVQRRWPLAATAGVVAVAAVGWLVIRRRTR